MAGKVSERMLARVWKRGSWNGEKLYPDGGEPLQVVYPGRENTDRGPDFRDAILATEGAELLQGDVEVHLKAGDWRIHGHHRDPEYNGVVLQVVWAGEGPPAMRQDGQPVPTVRLKNALSREALALLAGLPEQPTDPCAEKVAWLGPEDLGRILEEAGDRRFEQKSRLLEAQMAVAGPGQALYEGLMGALGYAKNKDPFQKLAQRVPLGVIQGSARGGSPQRKLEVIQALLLGSSGLLPLWRGPRLVAPALELEGLWRSQGPFEALEAGEWRFFRVRPGNSPFRRLAGASRLMARHVEEGLREVVLRLAVEGPPDRARGKLEETLVVDGEGERLIGLGRAREMVVNVVLPFCFAGGEWYAEPALRDRALALYRAYPALPENAATRRRGRILGIEATASARRQQGLLYLESSFCRGRRCLACPTQSRAGTLLYEEGSPSGGEVGPGLSRG